MSHPDRINRREFLKRSALATATLATGTHLGYAGKRGHISTSRPKKVIIIGFDGMDPRLCERLMNVGRLPHLDRLRKRGGFRVLGTSTPPQSPVAWANFINGAGPGSHGIFDFIHRHPEEQCLPFFAMAETIPGEGYWELGDYRLQLDFWPFNHKPPQTVLRRQGTPFWDYLDEAGIPSVFYDLPSNYPPSPSKYGHHRCLAGMGTPDMLGTYGTYQHYAEDGPAHPGDGGGGRRSRLTFESETAQATLIGPENSFLKQPRPATITFLVHRDRRARATVIDIQGHRLLLEEGQWSRWIPLDFELTTPGFLPSKKVHGICRFYLQQVDPIFRLYVSPININPSDPAMRITEPASFSKALSEALGLFYTTGFQEDHKALSNKVFTDDEFVRQAEIVLEERLKLLDYALRHYDDGLLFFYFSSTDLQSHMLWWDSDARHPTRTPEAARYYFGHIHRLYQKLDGVVGEILARYDREATILVMSDHGFANFGRQFNLNGWLRYYGYLEPADGTSLLVDVDWSRTLAYGLGINGLYLNLKGRERDGIVEPGQEREELLDELTVALESLTDYDGQRIIHRVHRTDEIYSGDATALAPDLIIGYRRGYRASWDTCLGGITDEILLDNDLAWSADHCADPSEVPGVLFSNRPIDAKAPSLMDIAPSVLAAFNLSVPPSMEGKPLSTTV